MKFNSEFLPDSEKSNGLGFWACLTFLMFLAYVVIFLHLGSSELNAWDEASYAFNAKQMLARPSLIMVYDYAGQPDHFSPKPPFYVWCAALSLQLFPENPELAIRIPSALFALSTLLLLFLFDSITLKNLRLGFISALIFVTSYGYFQVHLARTGDTDTTFVFFLVVTSVSYFSMSLSAEPKPSLGSSSGLCIGLLGAGLTKGPGLLILGPSFLLMLLIDKQFRKLLFDSRLWLSVCIPFTILLGYYFLRERSDPGFLEAVLKTEIGGRFQVLENQFTNDPPAIYFLTRMVRDGYFMPWLILLLASSSVFWFRPSADKRFVIFNLVIVSSMLLVLNQSKSIKQWYDGPLYPFMAMAVAGWITILVTAWPQKQKRVAMFALVIISGIPLSFIVWRNLYAPDHFFVRDCLKAYREEPNQHDTIVVYNKDFNFALYYYLTQDHEKGHHSYEDSRSCEVFESGATVLTFSLERRNEVNDRFYTTKLFTYENCLIEHLDSLKLNHK